jgi:tellurite resistance protein TehA-like permease
VATVGPLRFYAASLLSMLLVLALPAALGFRRPLYALGVAGILIALVYLVFSMLVEESLPREAILALIGWAG